MRIRRLELQGFKSFADRTSLSFGPGISALVGPNGCGKSNVVDAIRWVLGEQSPSTLRGRSMEDVVFAGSERRAGSGFAEVTVGFDNAEGRFPGALARFTEVDVGRRLHRNGDSEYLINRAQARLKDVTGLFLDAGVGARAYSIIEQGSVGFVMSAKPEERRGLIDEVAGVNRFRVQRAEAEKRLDQSRENLERARDLHDELGRQRAALEAQAERARRWRTLKRTVREASLSALLSEARAKHRQRLDIEAQCVAARERHAAADAELLAARTDLDVASARAGEAGRVEVDAERRLADLEAMATVTQREAGLRADERRRLVEQHDRLAADVSGGEARLVAIIDEQRRVDLELTERQVRLQTLRADAVQKAGAEARLREVLRGQRQELEGGKARALEAMAELSRERNALALLRQRHEDAVHRLEGHGVSVAEQRAQLAASSLAVERAEMALKTTQASTNEARDRLRVQDERSQAAKVALSAATTRLESAQQEHRRAQARLESLRELLRGHEGLDEGARALLAAGPPGSTPLGAAADLLDVPPELEASVAAALGEDLQGVVVAGVADAEAAASWLELGSHPRTRILVLDRERPPPLSGSLAERVVDGHRAYGLAALLLGGTRLSEQPRPPGAGERSVVGPNGRLQDDLGLWAGADRGRSSGLLARRREARDLEGRVAALDAAVRHASAELDGARQAQRNEEAARERVRRELHDAELEELGRKRDREEALREAKKLDSAVAQAERERNNLSTQAEALGKARAGQEQKLPALIERSERLEADLPALRERLNALEVDFEAATRHASSARVEAAGAEQQFAASERESQRLGPQRAEIERRLEGDRTQVAANQARVQWLCDDLERLAATTTTHQRDRAALVQAVEDARTSRIGHDAEVLRTRTRLAEATHQSEAQRGPLQRSELALAQSMVALEQDERQLALDHDLELKEFLGADGESLLIPVAEAAGGPIELDLRALDAHGAAATFRRDERRASRDLDALGAVNLAAVDELAATEERHGTLARQIADLEQAGADLRTAIHRLERETAQRFLAAFDAVQQRFAALYPRLVGGGRAELRLTRPDQPLETGVDLAVEPPGKKLQSLALLSGGEKAMAALALVFALFQVKPSPFCLLDEVDAPLDEANSRRFGDMLRELSSETQFLVITHNRATMEIADTLYGVTMQDPGVSQVVSVRLESGPPAAL